MNLDLYFEPVDFSKFVCAGWAQSKFTLGTLLEKNREKITPEKAELIIFGVGEDRHSNEPGSAQAPDMIRQHLYSLNRISPRFKVIDLGNMKLGRSVTDTYFALKDVCEILQGMGKTAIMLGGSQDLTLGMTKSFEHTPFRLISVDPKLDYQKGGKAVNSESYLNLIFEKQRKQLSYTLIGYQSYFMDALESDIFSQKNYEKLRLGQIRYDMASVEPMMRHADIFSFDMNAVRVMDAPGQYFGSPNGLYSEEACQLARYAGMADRISLAGFFNVLPSRDQHSITVGLMAQIVWHFIEGFFYRQPEWPGKHPGQFNQFLVDMDGIELPLTFFQSRKTGRWWMEIKDTEEAVQVIVPCTEEDYQTASRNEIPDRWWKNLRLLDQF